MLFAYLILWIVWRDMNDLVFSNVKWLIEKMHHVIMRGLTMRLFIRIPWYSILEDVDATWCDDELIALNVCEHKMDTFLNNYQYAVFLYLHSKIKTWGYRRPDEFKLCVPFRVACLRCNVVVTWKEMVLGWHSFLSCPSPTWLNGSSHLVVVLVLSFSSNWIMQFSHVKINHILGIHNFHLTLQLHQQP